MKIYMSWLIDGIVIIFILLCVFIGYKKGLVKVGIRLVSFLVAIIITFILYRPISEMIINYTQIDESIQNIVIENVSKKEVEKTNKEDIIEDTKNSILLNIANPLSYNVVYGGVMIILFIISRVILFFISALTDIVEKLPIIHQFNRMGGIIYGIIVGFFITNLILLIISFIAKANFNNRLEEQIQNTYITKLMYENNIFYIFLK